MFGPLLLIGITQIKGFEPGDADWGVKLDDVRGQAEAKEEVRRVVIALAVGRGSSRRPAASASAALLFLGAPGTGKTMLAKAIATGFNSPFVSIPGSGFAQTFIGMDAIVVRYLARKAKQLARKWGGQCIVFIDEIDAVGMRRQALGGGAAAASTPPMTRELHDDLLLRPVRRAHPDRRPDARDRGPGASGCSRAASARRSRAEPASAPARCASTASCSRRHGRRRAAGWRSTSCSSSWTASTTRRSCGACCTNRINTFLDATYIVPRRIGRRSLRLPRAAARAASRSTSSAPPTCRSTRSTRRSSARAAWAATSGSARRRRTTGYDIFDLYIDKVDARPRARHADAAATSSRASRTATRRR